MRRLFLASLLALAVGVVLVALLETIHSVRGDLEEDEP